MRSSWTWVLLVAAIGCSNGTGGDEKSQQSNLSGAIFTTLKDGTDVNVNNVDDRCDVYLNGGPEPVGAAKLPPGDYFFQVTDPSGKDLLSTDSVQQRQVTVDDNGVFTGVSGQGDHDVGDNLFDGGKTIQLCPMLPTTNPGCVFKVWITPTDKLAPQDPQANFGFLESESKTDNFRVCEGQFPPDAGPPDAGPGPDAGPRPDAGRPPDGGPVDEEDPGGFEQEP